jgi:hypothetical protein
MTDYGDTHTIAATDTKALPQVFAATPPFATCCCIPMSAIPQKYNELHGKVEAGLFSEEALTMRIIAVANDYLVVDFKTEHGTLIEDKISEGLAIRTTFEGYVTHVNTLEGVDVQNVDWTDKIEALAKTLEEADSYPPLAKPELGMHCVAKFEADGVFYRAQITSQSEAATEVCFYDYGNSAQVTDMRQIPDQVLKVKQLSQLLRVSNQPESQEVCDKIVAMLSDDSFKFEFLVLSATSYPSEVVVFKDGIDLRKLVQPGLNVMATEFSPQPVDLVKMIAEMNKGKTEKVKEAEVDVLREEGNVSLGSEMECGDADDSAKEVSFFKKIKFYWEVTIPAKS